MIPEILPLGQIPDNETGRWGGKATNLGRLIRIGAVVPPGFCISAEALDRTLVQAGLQTKIDDIAARLNFDDFTAVEKETAQIREMIEQAPMPADLRERITAFYNALVTPANRFVAVRSSVAVRGTSIASFPGMMDTYHYVLGADEVLEKVRECWASLWSARAAHVRKHKGIAHAQAIIAPVVQLMVNADSAGVLFTANPITKSRDECVIEANWGIGESVVSGRSMTDSFILDKATGKAKQRAVAKKTMMVVIDGERGRGRKEMPVPREQENVSTLSDEQLAHLCAIGRKIETDLDFPADIEWAYQGGELYILQARIIRNLETS